VDLTRLTDSSEDRDELHRRAHRSSIQPVPSKLGEFLPSELGDFLPEEDFVGVKLDLGRHQSTFTDHKDESNLQL